MRPRLEGPRLAGLRHRPQGEPTSRGSRGGLEAVSWTMPTPTASAAASPSSLPLPAAASTRCSTTAPTPSPGRSRISTPRCSGPSSRPTFRLARPHPARVPVMRRRDTAGSSSTPRCSASSPRPSAAPMSPRSSRSRAMPTRFGWNWAAPASTSSSSSRGRSRAAFGTTAVRHTARRSTSAARSTAPPMSGRSRPAGGRRSHERFRKGPEAVTRGADQGGREPAAEGPLPGDDADQVGGLPQAHPADPGDGPDRRRRATIGTSRAGERTVRW